MDAIIYLPLSGSLPGPNSQAWRTLSACGILELSHDHISYADVFLMTIVMQIGAILVIFPNKESRNLTFSYMLHLDQVVHNMLNESI